MLFRFRDSLNLLPGKLSELAKNLCPDLGTKGSIPYDELKASEVRKTLYYSLGAYSHSFLCSFNALLVDWKCAQVVDMPKAKRSEAPESPPFDKSDNTKRNKRSEGSTEEIGARSIFYLVKKYEYKGSFRSRETFTFRVIGLEFSSIVLRISNRVIGNSEAHTSQV
ncbi:hypothetical protein V6N13_072335 [Hibiscus sabdariffa]|uniref:Uncharacterized protein n=1 Tax=Hibiscus sabdariffa TaxID=183260 RepID=A0ABR2AFE3_9ROSI